MITNAVKRRKPRLTDKEKKKNNRMRTKKSDALRIANLEKVEDKGLKHISNQLSISASSMAEIQYRSPIIWVKRNIYTEKGDPMDFMDRPYLVDIYKDFSQHIAVRKGAQIGLTQLSVAKCLYVADTKNITVIYTFPNAMDVGKFSKGRFKSIINYSAYLRSRVKGVDTANLKSIGESKVYFNGTFSESQAISVPSDLNIHDELDFSNPEVRDMYSDRLSVSALKWEWDFSTPTLPKYGIDGLWRESDKHVRVFKCSRCNKWQQIYFFKNVFTRKKEVREKRFYYGCRYCQKLLDRRKGEWISLRPNKEVRGYFVPQEICPVIPARDLVIKYRRGKKQFGGLKKFFNFNLGRPYESGEDRITKDMILSKVVPGTIEQGKIVIGADQGDILHVVVSKITDRRRHIWIGKLDSIPELVKMIDSYRSRFPTLCVLDALPNHNESVRYATSMPNLYLCYYDKEMKVTELMEEKMRKKIQDEKSVHISRTDLLDHTAALWSSGDVVIENYIQRPVIDEFADQMKNMKRDLIEDTRTKMHKAVWVKIGDDHYRHADAYNFIAAELMSNARSEVVASTGAMTIDNENSGFFTEDEVW